MATLDYFGMSQADITTYFNKYGITADDLLAIGFEWDEEGFLAVYDAEDGDGNDLPDILDALIALKSDYTDLISVGQDGG